MIYALKRGRGHSHSPDKQGKRIGNTWLTGIFLLTVFTQAVVAQQTASPAQRPQFRSSQPPPPVLDNSTYRSAGGGFTGTEGLTNVPPGAFQQDRFGVSQATLFRNTTFPYGPIVSPPPISPTVHSENASAGFTLNLPVLTGGLPWTQRGFEPQDADLKLGPFFFKLRAVQGAILFSDNINLTPDHEESGEIAIMSATLDIIAQITEDLRLTTSATFAYLPLQGKAGVAGFGLTDIYNFGLAAGPLSHVQLQWDTDIGGWHVVVSDDFQILQVSFSNDFRSDNVLFEGSRFDEESRAGRYVFRPQEGAVYRNNGSHNQGNDLRSDLVTYSNTISVEAERLSPGEILLRARAYHEDLWYNQGNRGQPSLREGATIALISQRENMRFKPYFIYDIFRTDQDNDVQHIFRAGVTGPITDQLYLLAEAGYYTGGLANNGGLWRIELDHTAGPYTQESLIYSRQFNYFHDEVDEALGYNLHQILGPRMSLDGYVYRVRAQEFFSDSSENTTRNEWRAGLRLNYIVGPKTTLLLTGEYAEVDPDNTVAWTGRLELGYNFTDTLLLHFAYQHQKSTSDNALFNYTENMLFLSLTKYFE